MRSFSHWIFSLFTTPIGIAALDSTLVFFVPLGIDGRSLRSGEASRQNSFTHSQQRRRGSRRARSHSLAVCRLLRFGAEAALAAIYGRQIVSWLESDLLYDIASFFTAVAAIVTGVSIVLLSPKWPPQKRRAAA
jgi:hypothetical protein